LQSFKNIRVDDFFCNFLDKRFCFFFLKLEQIFIFQRSHSVSLFKDMIDTTIDNFSDNNKVDRKNLSILFGSALTDLPNAT
jgi:hypothetical protein